MKNKTNWIICFGDHWSSLNMGSPGNIMLELYNRDKKILWINPIPKTNLTLHKTNGSKKVFLERILSKIASSAKIIKKYKRSFWIITPFYLPFVENKYICKINEFSYRVTLKLLFTIFHISNYVIYNFNSNPIYKFIDIGKSEGFYHIAADMHSDLRTATEKQRIVLIKNEGENFSKADFIFPASRRIADRIIEIHGFKEKIHLLPHGVDFKHFSENISPTKDLSKYNKPMIGYFGSLTFANDIDIYEAIAKTGYTFILIGKVSGDYTRIKKYSNVHFLGPINYNELPNYACHFDVCIMAWKQADWIKNCNPKKTLEYLALGKPVVSITIPHLKEQFEDLIYFADTPSHFVGKINQAFAEDSKQKIQERIYEAKKHDWSKVVDNLEKVIRFREK